MMHTLSRFTFCRLTLVFGLLLILSALLACGANGEDNPATDSDAGADDVDLSVALFAPDHLIEVEVELDPADWATLQQEGRHLTDVFTGCAREYEYTYFHARVTVDGESYEDVAVRKKGFLGSLSTLRPSLKVNFGKFVEDRTHADMKRMTLNNNLTDASNTHQCMAYALFAQVGAIAPRCNFAHVVVNGNDLGIYTHVESIKKPMLRRHFEDDSGNLYEGQGADFIAARVDLMELKTNKLENDRSDLDAVTEALLVDDSELFDALAQVVDIDAFLTFWSMEVITGHWDSYSGGPNNYLTYHDPTSDRFLFIPWGTDGAFSQTRPFSGDNRNVSVLAQGRIANRLYAHPEGRAMYFDRLNELFEQVWDENELLAESERIKALTDAAPSAIEAHRNFITVQGEAMRAALAASDMAPDWINRPGGDSEIMCRPERATTMSGTFSTSWGSPGPSEPAPSVNLTINGQPWQPNLLLSGAGLASDDPNNTQIIIVSPQPSGRIHALVLRLPAVYFSEGAHAMHGVETNVIMVDLDPQASSELRLIGFGGSGSITLDAASMEPGGAVTGHFEGKFVQIAPLL